MVVGPLLESVDDPVDRKEVSSCYYIKGFALELFDPDQAVRVAVRLAESAARLRLELLSSATSAVRDSGFVDDLDEIERAARAFVAAHESRGGGVDVVEGAEPDAATEDPEAHSFRWLEIATQLRAELPGDWSLRGEGSRLRIVREPVDWSFDWFGHAPSRSGGHLYAAVQPLVLSDFGWILDYGMRMDSAAGGPPTIDLFADDAVDVARSFVLGPGLAKLDEWTAARLADTAEQASRHLSELDPPPAGKAEVAESAARISLFNQVRPPYHWRMTPGWRVVNDTGSPVEPAQTAIAWTEALWGHFGDRRTQAMVARHVAFYRSIIDAWQSGGRPAALRLLVEHRDRIVDEQVVDVVQERHGT